MNAVHDKDDLLREAADRFGTPLFVYFLDDIAARAQQIKEGFGGRFALSYAVKSNPNPHLLEWLSSRIEFLDISSHGEFLLGSRGGWQANRMSFTGPGKRAFEVEDTLSKGLGELILESPREAALANEVAGKIGRKQDVLVRLAPAVVPKGFGDNMAGRPCAFGIDVEDVERDLPPILALPNLNVVGFHIYSGTQCLRADAIRQNYQIFMETFATVCEAHDVTPEKLTFGSGLGIPYHDSDKPLEFDKVTSGVNEDLDAFKARPRFRSSTLILELGRYLVGEAGFFATRVVSTKHSRGADIAICDGGMNNHLPASGNFGMVVPRNYSMHRVGGGESKAPVNLVGPLCTSIDRLGRGVELPRLDEGDLVAVHNSGAYGPSASPLHFISHPMPREVIVSGGVMKDVTRKLSDLSPLGV